MIAFSSLYDHDRETAFASSDQPAGLTPVMQMSKHQGHGKALAPSDPPVETIPETPTGNRHDRQGIDNRPVEIGGERVMLQRHDKDGIDNCLVEIDPETAGRSNDQTDNHATGALMAIEILQNTPAPLAR